MSLFNRDFLTFDGNPITGRQPTQILVYAEPGVQLTPEQRARTEHAYKLFCDSVKTSANPGMYHIQNRQLPDGTRIRMESNSGMDRVMVWPVAGEDEEFATFYGIPYDETYINAPTGDPDELAKEAVFFIKRVHMSKSAPQTILNGLKLATDHGMYPSLVEGEANKPSQPGNTTWYAKKKKTTPILSWWGQYSRYSNSQKQRSDWAQKVWGRSLLVNNVFWQDEASNALKKYPPIYNADYGTDGSSTIENPASSFGDENDLRDYLWISGKRVKTGILAETGKWILSACIGKRQGARVVRMCIGTVFPTDVVEVSLTTMLRAAKDEADLVYAQDCTAYTISPDLPAEIGVASNLVNWASQPPYWNSSGSECAGIVDSYFQAGVPEITYYLYKISYDDDSGTLSTSIVEYAEQTESWSYERGGATVTGSVTSSSAVAKLEGSYTDNRPIVFSSSITASKPIAVDYDGDEIVVIRSTYSETMGRNYLFSVSYDGVNSSTSETLTSTWTCGTDGVVVVATDDTPLVYSGTQDHTKSFSETRQIEQGSVLLKNSTRLIERARNYSANVSAELVIHGVGTSTIAVTQATGTRFQTHDPGGVTHSGSYVDDVATATFTYDETYSRMVSVQESASGVASDYSVVGDLRTGVFVVHESEIPYGQFADRPPSGYFGYGLNVGVSPDIKEGSYSLSISDSVSCTGSCDSRSDWMAGVNYQTSDTFSHGVSGSSNYTIPPMLGAVSLVIGDTVVQIDSAAENGYASVIRSKRDYVPYTPYDATMAHTLANTSSWYSVQNSFGVGSNCLAGAQVFAGDDFSKYTFGYTYSTATVSGAVFSPPSTNSDPIEISYLPATRTTASAGTTSTSSGTYKRRFSSGGLGQSTGAGGYPYYTVASSASTKNGFATYIGYQTETLIRHAAPNDPYVVKLDTWVVNGDVVVPSKEYPHTGAYKMFSCPVFV